MSNRNYHIVAIMIMFIMLLLIACSGSTDSGTVNNDGNFQGTIKMYAGDYSPNKVFTDTQEEATVLQELADEYEKENPGVKIEFVKGLPADQDYMTWVRTKSSGGQLPDIIWMQWYDANSSLAKGILTDLSDHLEEPNPYADDSIWKDLLNKQILADTSASDGSTYIINGDYVGTATYYNKDAFEEAGISQLPKTWSEYIDVSKKLEEAGYIPTVWNLASTPTGKDRVTWLSRLFYTNFYADEYDDLRYTGEEGITTKDQVIAIKNGDFGSENEKWTALWPIIKDFSEYWQPDFTGGDSEGRGNMLAFLSGEVGMYFDASGAAQELKSADPDFEWDSFKHPIPDQETSEYATDFDSSGAIGGPSATFQYGVPSEKSNNTLTSEKEEAIIDWLMFITTPDNNEAIVNELGLNVPTIKGTEPIEELKDLSTLSDQPLQSVFGGINLNQKQLDAIFRSLQGYITGENTLEEFLEVADTEMEKAADEIIEREEWDLSEYIR